MRAARRVMVAQEVEAPRFVFVDEMGTSTSLSRCAVRLFGSQRPEGALFGGAQPWEEHHALGEHDRRGDGAAVLGGGRLGYQGGVFEAYVEASALPAILSEGQVVVVDNLAAHKGERVKDLTERRGCELLYLPPYSPDFNPIEEAFAKTEGLLRKAGARRRETLVEAMGVGRSRR